MFGVASKRKKSSTWREAETVERVLISDVDTLRGCQLSKSNTCKTITFIKKNDNFTKEARYSRSILEWVIQKSSTDHFMLQNAALEGSAIRLAAV